MLQLSDPMQMYLGALLIAYEGVHTVKEMAATGASKLAMLNAIGNAHTRIRSAQWHLDEMERTMTTTPCASEDDLDEASGMHTDLCMAFEDARAFWHAKVAEENRGVNHGTVDKTSS